MRSPFGDGGLSSGIGGDRNTTGGGGGGAGDDDDGGGVGGGGDDDDGGGGGGGRDDDDDDDNRNPFGGGAPDSGDDRNTVGGGGDDDTDTGGSDDEPALGGGGAPDSGDDRNTVGGGGGDDDPVLGGGGAPDPGDADRNETGTPGTVGDPGDDRNTVGSGDPTAPDPTAPEPDPPDPDAGVGDDRNTVGEPGMADPMPGDDRQGVVDEQSARDRLGDDRQGVVGPSPLPEARFVSEFDAQTRSDVSVDDVRIENGRVGLTRDAQLDEQEARANAQLDAAEPQAPEPAEEAGFLEEAAVTYEQQITQPAGDAVATVTPAAAVERRVLGTQATGGLVEGATETVVGAANVPAAIVGAREATETAGEITADPTVVGGVPVTAVPIFDQDELVEQRGESVAAAGEAAAAARASPFETTGALVGGALAGGAATRASRAARSGAGRVTTPDLELGDTLSRTRTRAPDIEIRRDPDAGAVDVDPLLTQQARERGADLASGARARARSAADRVASVNEPAATTSSDVFGRPLGTERARTPDVDVTRDTDTVATSGTTETREVFGRPLRSDAPTRSLGDRLPNAPDTDLGDQFPTRQTRDVFGRPLRSDAPTRDVGGSVPDVSIPDIRDRLPSIEQPADTTTRDVFGRPLRADADTPGVRERLPDAPEFDTGDLRDRLPSIEQPADTTTRDVFGRPARTDADTPTVRERLPDPPAAPSTGDLRDRLPSIEQPADTTTRDVFGRPLRADADTPGVRERLPDAPALGDFTLRVGPIRPQRRRVGALDDVDVDETIDDADIPGGATGGGDVDIDVGDATPRGGGGQVAIQRVRGRQRRGGRTETRQVQRQRTPEAPDDEGRGLFATGAIGAGLGLGAPDTDATVGGATPTADRAEPGVGVAPTFEPLEDRDVDVGRGPDIGPTLTDETAVAQEPGLGQRSGAEEDTAVAQEPALQQPVRERQRPITTTTPRLRDEPRRPRAGRERGIDIDDDVPDGIDTESFTFGFDPDVGILSGEEI